jgi:hypothetical protein
MARRSRSQRPRKTRTSEVPAPDGLAPAVPALAAGHLPWGSAEPGAPPARAAAAAGPIDELAALDAGWDDLST